MALFLALIIAAVSLAHTAAAPSTAFFGQDRFEFTTGYTEAVTEFDLPIANRTGNPVKVLSVETSCTCMKVSVPELQLEPGATGRVHCTFTVPNATGPIQKPVILHTDIPGHPTELAMVQVEVPSVLTTAPDRLAWTVGAANEEKVMRIEVADESALHLEKIQCSRDLFEWSIRTIRDGHEYELRVKPKSTQNPALGMFLIQTDSAVPRQKTRSLYAVVRSRTGGEEVLSRTGNEEVSGTGTQGGNPKSGPQEAALQGPGK